MRRSRLGASRIAADVAHAMVFRTRASSYNGNVSFMRCSARDASGFLTRTTTDAPNTDAATVRDYMASGAPLGNRTTPWRPAMRSGERGRQCQER